MTYAPTDEFVIPADPTQVVPEGGNAQPLPVGTKVLARIMPTKKNGGAFDRRPYAKEGSPNSRITALAVRFEIVPGQRGAGRNVFPFGAGIPMARKFATGKTAFDFYGFFRALGYDVDGDFVYPGDQALLGQEIELVLGIDQDKDGEDRNFARFYNKANGIPTQSAAAPRPAAAQQAWTPGTTPEATAPAQAPAQPAWLPPGAQPAAADPATQQAVQDAAASGKSF